METDLRIGTDTGVRAGAGGYSHASIVWGGAEPDRDGYANRLAQAMVCSAPGGASASGERPCLSCAHCVKASKGIHPDIIAVDRLEEKQNILVDQIRAVREDAVILPNEASKKVYIIRHADTMNPQAQNAFLKLLEEPPESSNFILVAENPSGLLPTVRSRCVELSCEHQDLSRKSNGTADAFCQALTGDALALNAFSYVLDKLDRNSFEEFIDAALELISEKLRYGAAVGPDPRTLMRAVDVLNRARDYFKSNVSLVHIAGMICAELIETEKRGKK
jgi:hypothetical protein